MVKNIVSSFIYSILMVFVTIGALTATENFGISEDSIYTVPMTNPALLPYAGFILPDFKIRRKNGRVRVSYTLPKELIGRELKVHFDGEDLAHLSGEYGEMTCSLQDKCEVHYRDLKIQPPEVQSTLAAKHPASELSARMEVSSIFSGDPIGIIVIGSNR